MDIPGLPAIISKILTECGFISALSVSVAAVSMIQLARVRAAWEADRKKSEEKLVKANETIIELVEAGSKSDANVAIALEGVKTILIALQARGT